MFWEAVISGLSVLSYWQTWLVFALYGLSQFALIILIGGISSRSAPLGCIAVPFLAPIWEIVTNSLLIVLLLPVLLGGVNLLPLSAIPYLLKPILTAGFAAFIISLVLSWIPLIGSLLRNNPAVEIFIENIVIFYFLSQGFIHILFPNLGTQGIYPPFGYLLGFFCIEIVLGFVLVLILSIILSRLGADMENPQSTLALTLFGGFVAYVPLFMYARYVYLSISTIVGG